MARLFADFISGTTTANLTISGTTIQGAFLAKVPEVSGGDIYALTLDPEAVDGAPEIVHVTAHTASATTATIVREQEGTSRRAHQSGTKVIGSLTKAHLDEIALGDPVGRIEMFAGTTAPEGWLMCDGQEASRTANPRLFAAIGTTYGAGDGSTTFNMPDLRQRFPIGKAESGTASEMGETGGAIDHTHAGPNHNHGMAHTHSVNPPNTSTTSVGNHSHNITGFVGGQTASQSVSNVTGAKIDVAGTSHIHGAGSLTASSTGSHSHNVNIASFTSGGSSTSTTGNGGTGQTSAANPPYLALNFIIRAG